MALYLVLKSVRKNNLQKLFKKLDLNDYLDKFNSFLARPKPLFLSGDSKINYEKITELAKFDLNPPKEVINLDDALMRISKQGILHIKEIYEFVKIIQYFIYLKKQKFENKMSQYLDKIIIPEEISNLNKFFDDNGEIKESIDERLVAINLAYKQKKEQIRIELGALINSKNLAPYLVDSNVHYINDSEALLVRGGFNQILKGSVIARSSGGFFYVSPNTISNLKHEQSALIDKKEEIIFEYAKKISNIFYKNLLFLKFINSAFDQIDALLARVFMAKNADLDFVLSDNSKDIILKEFAHPALHDPKRVSVEFTGKVLLITGVNAGGKSMLLKSILTAAILAKYLLPMKINPFGSKIGSFKEFDAILEDPQNVKDDISTFAGRMLQFSKLFAKKSLLIGVDEIELGTDSKEAASLYGVIIEKLLENDIKMVITTHHKELALIISKFDSVNLLAALYDEKIAKPKFEFLAGIIGKSYAFETALRYNIPANLVSNAKKLHGQENLNDAITKAINLESELKIKLQKTAIKEQKLDNLIENLKEQKINADEKLRLEISRLENEYFRAINEAKRGINLNDTKEKQRSLNKANELLKAVKKPDFQPQKVELKIGDFVKYGNIKGEVVALKDNEASIISDGIKLRVPLNLLKKGGKEILLPSKKANISVQKPNSASVVLDLHGLRADEALDKLDKFISDSLVMGFDEVLVKHGIGTGKLAFAVKEFLKSHPSVKSFADGLPNEGGFGSKVVKL